MEGWEIALLAVSGYVAVMALVRLMLARRDRLLKELREQAENEARIKAKEARLLSKKKAG
jgi:hypothetical protein